MDAEWHAENVGILGIEIYLPKYYVEQAELEKFDGVGAGKYTIGLGQRRMAFVGDREDINSVCLTAVHRLMKRHNLKPEQIGRLEVGTETLVDKSKSVKSTLMMMFPHGDVEGVDHTNACYGGTNCMFAAVDWVESSAWNGKLAIVVAGDIAVYAPGPARPTGGTGVCALLIGPDAPVVLDRGIRATHMEHVWDFYKPVMDSEYPEVDGKLSLVCYLRALDLCYERFKARYEAKHKDGKFSLAKTEFVAMHTPFIGLVKKAFSRLSFLDMLAGVREAPEEMKAFFHLKDPGAWIGNRDCVSSLGKLMKADLAAKVAPGLLVSQDVGNIYCGALSGAILSILNASELKRGDKILCFSYGSGLAAAMFQLVVRADKDELSQRFSDISAVLAARDAKTPQEFTDTMLRREKMPEKSYVPADGLDTLLPDCWYLEKIDDAYRRYYKLNEY